MNRKLFGAHALLSASFYICGGIDALIVVFLLSALTLGLGILSIYCLRWLNSAPECGASKKLLEISTRLAIFLPSIFLMMMHFQVSDLGFMKINESTYYTMLEYALIGHLLIIKAELIHSIKEDVFSRRIRNN